MSITIADGTNDIVVSFLNDKGVVNIETVTIPATGDIAQGDYVVLSNTAGDTIAVWFDLDEDGTEPTGAAYGAADATLLIPIATGDTSIQNATTVFGLLSADTWSDSMILTDNLNGTIKVATAIGVAPTAADPHNADDSTVGSITISATQVGAATRTTRVDYLPKEGLKVIEYARDGYLYLITQEGCTSRSTPDGRYKYSEITSPSTASLTALVSQINTWVSPIDPTDSSVTGIVNGEYAATLSDTVDLAHAGWFTPTLLAGTVKYTTVFGEVITRAYELNETSLVRVKRIWSIGTTPDMGININY